MKPMALSCISSSSLSQSLDDDIQARISHISTNDPTPLNAQDLGTCEAKVNGVPCQRPASVNYVVNATGWISDPPESRYYPPEERHLCDEHFRRVQRLALFIAGVERLQMEGDVA